MKILVTGGTGFIGKHLIKALQEDRHHILVLTRHSSSGEVENNIKYLQWMTDDESWKMEAEGSEIIIHLAGENIASSRWTEQKMNKIERSRLKSGALLIETITQWKKKPKLFIQGSAIGYYGSSDGDISETSKPGSGYLSNLAGRWENSTIDLEKVGIVRAIIRIGVVLEKDGGVFNRMITPFRLGLGGTIGSGNQGFSWIHMNDVVNAIRFIIRKELSGIFNLTSPEPVSLRDFTKELARALNRPHLFSIPSFILNLGLGKMADELILGGAKVFPERLLALGYIFKYNKTEYAIDDLISKSYTGSR